MALRNHTAKESRFFGNSCSAAPFGRIKSRRAPDSQSGMLALRAFAVGHFAAKLACSFPMSLFNSSREKKGKHPMGFRSLSCALYSLCAAHADAKFFPSVSAYGLLSAERGNMYHSFSESLFPFFAKE